MANGTRIRRLRRNLGLTGAIVAISVGVLLPVVLASSAGIVAIAIGEGTADLTLGILMTVFAFSAVGGGVIATVLIGRRAHLARLQSDLLANVTHELRTPLSAIRLHAETLQQEGVADDPEVLAHSLGTIVRETEWLEAMIERVLTWRSAEKDRSALDKIAEPIAPTVEEVVHRFERMVEEGEVDLTVEIDTDAVVEHDGRAIGSIVLNLLTNAYKYTGDDKRIAVKVHDELGDVIIRVSDNGIGMPEGEYGRVFDPFHRVDSRLKSKSSGAGLGLAIVRHMVRLHGGKVYVESEEGKGSTFAVHLPVVGEKK